MIEIKERFRNFLNERDMRLSQAAILLNCSIGALSNFLNGKTNPHDRTIYKIKKLIGEK